MHTTSFTARLVIAGLILFSIAGIGGCRQNPPPATDNPPASGQANATTAAVDKLISNVQVKGDEQLPPGHPPLPAEAPPHPTAQSDSSPPNFDQQLAAQHPKPEGMKKLAVTVPDSVKGKWELVTLAVTADGGAERQIKLAIGDMISLGENLQLRLVHYLPAYTSDLQAVTSSSSEPINPAVQIQAISNGQVRTEGWIFQNLPEFNSFKSKQVAVRLIAAVRADRK